MPTPIVKRKRGQGLASWMPAITVVVGLLVAGGGYFLILVPKIGPLMPGGQYDFTALRQRFDEDTKYAATMKGSLAAYQSLSADKKNNVKKMMPAEADFPNLMVALDALATRHSLTMTSLDAVTDDRAVSTTGRRSVRLSISVSGGDYPGLKSFLGELEKSLRLIDASAVAYTPDGGLGLTLRTYYVDLLALEAANKPAKPAAAPTTTE
jgi:Tfp pilus assembly protein PilO